MWEYEKKVFAAKTNKSLAGTLKACEHCFKKEISQLFEFMDPLKLYDMIDNLFFGVCLMFKSHNDSFQTSNPTT